MHVHVCATKIQLHLHYLQIASNFICNIIVTLQKISNEKFNVGGLMQHYFILLLFAKSELTKKFFLCRGCDAVDVSVNQKERDIKFHYINT